MRVRLPALAVASFVLAACGGGGPPSPAGLGYSLPDPATATYVTGDTVNVAPYVAETAVLLSII